MRALFLPLLTTLCVQAQWGYAYTSCSGCPQMPQMPQMPFMPQMPQMPFMPFAPFPPMPPMMPIVPHHVGNGMGGYVTSGKTANGGNFAAAGSYSNSNGNGPFRTVSYSTQSPGGGTRLPYRPYPAPPSNTVHQESEKRVKLPNGGELITKTMVEKTPNGQRVSSFSYSQNPLGPVIPAAAARNLPGGKLPFSTKERLEQYKPPLEGAEPEGDIYIREGSGESPQPATASTQSSPGSLQPSFAFASQSSSSGQPTVSFTSQSSNGQPPTYSFSSQSSNNGQPAVAYASQSSNAIFD